MAKAKEIQEKTKEEPVVSDVADKKAAPAKAGKRSTKAVKEAEEKQAKEDRKTQASPEESSKKSVKKTQNPTRPRAERKGKKFREAKKLVEKDKTYSIQEALSLAIKTTTSKFDATIEMHVNLGVDPRHADQNIRDSVVLPSGTGKTVKIAAFVDEEDSEKAKKAGADIVGIDKIKGLLDKSSLDFDILVATPKNMPTLGKYAKLLGPRGLMPNPKSGTVTTDIVKAISEAKAGRVEYRVDSSGIVHLGIGKVSFGESKLNTNFQAVLSSIKNAKPTSLKGTYIKSVYLTTTMGPSVQVSLSSVQ